MLTILRNKYTNGSARERLHRSKRGLEILPQYFSTCGDVQLQACRDSER